MKLRFLEPGDRDFTGAPSAGAGIVFFDEVAGSDTNDGTTAAKARRSMDFFPASIPANGKVVLRRGRRQIFRRTAREPNPTTYAWPVTASGTAGNEARIETWGSGDEPFITGEIRYGAGWSAVANSYGNTWLATNGLQKEAGNWETIWHVLTKGRDMFTPCFWSPATPADVSQVCRWDFFANAPGGEQSFFEIAGNHQGAPASLGGSPTQWASTDYDVTKKIRFRVLNETGVVGITTNNLDHETQVQFHYPEIAAYYGTTDLVGAKIAYRRNPANQPDWLTIIAYDSGTSVITASTGVIRVGSGGPNYPASGSGWCILGHPFDLRQPGQCAILPRGGGNQRLWLVDGDWMTGQRGIAGWENIINLSGAHVIVDPIQIGRQCGPKNSSVDSRALQTTSLSNFVINSPWLRQALSKNQDRFWLGDQSNPTTNGVVNNVRVSEAYTNGALLLTGYQNVNFNGGSISNLGRSALSFSRNSVDCIVSDMSYSHDVTYHGNGEVTYENSRQCTFQYGLCVDRVLNSTSQVEGVGPATPRGNKKLNGIYSLSRAISPSAGAGYITNSTITNDNGFESALYDRIWVPQANTFGVYVGDGGVGNGEQNDNAVIKRSAIHNLVFDTGAGAATAGGSAVLVRDVVSTAPGGNTPSNWTTQGANVVRSELTPSTPNGCLSVVAWEHLTRTEANTTEEVGAHEAIRIGPDWVDWQLPAYDHADPVAAAGAAVELRQSRDWYWRNWQAGRAQSMVLRTRPGSTIALVAGAVDNASFILDRGHIVPTVRMTAASYTVRVRETTLSGATRDTDFVLTGRN
jgi:hypothetical protein